MPRYVGVVEFLFRVIRGVFECLQDSFATSVCSIVSLIRNIDAISDRGGVNTEMA
jgi:hypothetical protein